MRETTTQQFADEARGSVKRFGAILAADEVDPSVVAGTVYGVLGPGRAGETAASS